MFLTTCAVCAKALDLTRWRSYEPPQRRSALHAAFGQWPDNRNEIMQMNANLAAAYERAERVEESIALKRECLHEAKAMTGPRSELTTVCANNLGCALMAKGSFTEAKTLLKAQLAYQADAELDNELSIRLFGNYAKALYKNPDAVPDDILEAIAMYEKEITAARRLWGEGPLDAI